MRISFLALALSLAVNPALAAPWAAALEQAWTRDPEARALEAGAGVAAARREAAGRYLGAPELEGRHWDGEAGARESELELSLPLRWPGERAAARTLAERAGCQREAELLARRLSLAGELREAAWEARAAAAETAQARGRAELSRALARDIAAQVRAGEKAETDRLLAETERLAAEQALARAEQAEAQAEARWQALVGEGVAAPESPEPAAEAPEPDTHPELLALVAERAAVQARRAAEAQSGREAPRLRAGLRRERAETGLPAETAVGLGFTLPLGERPEQGVRLAELDQALLALDARLARRREALARERSLAEARQAQAERLAALAAQQAELAGSQRRHARRALDLGELSLIDYTRAAALAAEAERAAALALVERGRARARLNQVLGVLP